MHESLIGSRAEHDTCERQQWYSYSVLVVVRANICSDVAWVVYESHESITYR